MSWEPLSLAALRAAHSVSGNVRRRWGVCHRAHAARSRLRVEAAQPRSVNCKAPEPKAVRFRKRQVLP